MVLRSIIILFSFLFFSPAEFLYAETLVLQSDDVTIHFEKELTKVAQEVIKVYPLIRDELMKTLKQKVDFRPDVVLVKERDIFRRISGSEMIIAFALPGRNLIVLDVSRVYAKPFTLETTLKHELCHLILHGGVGGENIPRWFDEGVCQWSSGGIAELMLDESDKSLAKAVVSERLISLNELERFPFDGQSLILAYEESKSVLEYIAGKYGGESVVHMLEYLKEGDSISGSIVKSLSISQEELEKNWQTYLKRKYTWYSYVSNNLYIILFTLAGLITIYGFIRLIKKKRGYVDEENEDENSENRKI
jgi:hypothetical protein